MGCDNWDCYVRVFLSKMRLTLIVLFFFLITSKSVFAQCIKGNCLDGTGTYNFESGAQYSGEWINGNLYKGILIFPNGNKYTGEFKDNKLNGKGKLIFTNGDEYEGEWKDSKKDGKGIIKLSNGDRYEGEFKDDKYNGLGIFTFLDGNKYEGEFKDDNYHGEGIFYFSDGRVIQGTFKNGELFKEHEVNQTASSKEYQKEESSGYDIYNNIDFNWTLFGTRLYDKIDNVKLIGKFVLDRKEAVYCLTDLKQKPLNINPATNKKGCLKDFAGLITDYIPRVGLKYNSYYLIEPLNKNDLFSIYIIEYSPLEKRILRILARKDATTSMEICDDEGNKFISIIDENLSENKKYSFQKLKKEFSSKFEIRLNPKNNELKNKTGEDEVDNIQALYYFKCNQGISGVERANLFLILEDIYSSRKSRKEIDIIEKMQSQTDKENSEEIIESKTKDGLL